MKHLPRLALTALVLTLCVHTADAAKHKARKAARTPKPTPCSVHCLDTLMDQYLDALIQHKPGNVKHAVKFKYTENGEPLKLGEGLWRKASSIGKYHRVFYDSLSQQAVFVGVVNEGNEPTIAALRIGIEGGRIVEIEHIVARQGSHPLFAPDKLGVADPALTESIDQDQRVSRTRMVAIASSYLDGIEQHSSANIKAAETCQRVENGVQTTNRPGGTSRNCQDSANVLTYIKAVQNRRFPIVDPEHGIVVATFLFDIPGGAEPAPVATPATEPSPAEAPTPTSESTTEPTTEATPPPPAAPPPPPPVVHEPRTLLLTEWFRIDHGAIQHIEAVMHNLPHGSKSGWELDE
jgi:hypothetical protein